jgi:Rrf2 family protein
MLSNTHFSMAVHVLSVLAYQEGRLVGSEDLARSVDTNPSFLRGLIGVLRNAALVETRVGKGGGTTLARPATRITLYDVYLATESQPALKSHECNDRSKCIVARNMVGLLEDVNQRLEGAVEEELKKMTLADLVSQYIGKSA